MKRRDVLKGAAAIGAGVLLETQTTRAQSSGGSKQQAAAKKWIDDEFSPSVLSKDEQMAEMEWFIKAAEPFKGMEVNCVSEILDVHEYESKTLTKAFEEITGIHVKHDLMDEGTLVEKLEVEMQSGRPIYDFWMNDSDFIGTHPRYNDIVDGSLTDFMQKNGKDITNPHLDLNDFIGKSFGTFTDGKLYQLPDQQFANLYWFRYDWFQRKDLQDKFEKAYGYPLGVPINWSAYEDIADFFTNKVKNLDGKRIYGHMDYGKKDPSLGWRFTDAWLAMAGATSMGLPNGLPTDEWGIRNIDNRPRGTSIERGGGANSPAAVYALTKYLEWIKKYAPPEALGMDFLQAGPVPGQGHIAQQIFWYSAFTKSLLTPGLPVMNDDGTPKWRMAPSPHGAYWREGMKVGYQDCGCWTMMKYAPMKKIRAGWLYAQFCVSKTVSLKKSLNSLHFIRRSDLMHPAMDKIAPKTGGLIEFYRSPAQDMWTPTGVNVPDYGKMSQVWWQNVSDAISGAKTPQQAMDSLAEAQDEILDRIERSGIQGKLGPKLNPKKSAEYWFKQGEKDGDFALQRKLANEKPQGKTVPYDKLIESWKKTSGTLPEVQKAREHVDKIEATWKS